MGKLDPKTVSCHFIGYPDKSKAYRFYCPNRATKFVETRHAVFLESDMMRGSTTPREIILEEKQEYVPTPIIQEPIFPVSVDVAPPVERTVNATPAETPVTVSDATPNDVSVENSQQPSIVDDVPINEPLRRSQRTRKPAIPNDYLTYLSKDMNESMLDNDPTSFKEAMQSEFSSEWLNAMRDEMKSLSTN